MENNIIFIHIPKTGGTTINTAMKKSYWQTKPDFNYRHILPVTKDSNSGDIFKPENFKKYSHFDVFMMLRHPVDRAVSEYYFMKERKEFMKLLKPFPKNFTEFVNNPQTHNYVISFLMGNKIYSQKRPHQSDLVQIIDAIEAIPIKVGIFEQFGKSMQMFANKTEIEWNKNIEAKRMTFIRPDVEELSDEIKNKIIKFNKLDLELYNYCLNKFNTENNSLSASKIKFVVNKYNHVKPYMANFPFFEFCMNNKDFINSNIKYFKELTNCLLHTKKITDGKKLTKAWNASFVNSIKTYFDKTDFYFSILSAFNSEKEPLKQTEAIASALDIFFIKNKKQSKKYLHSMKFKDSLVVIPKPEFKQFVKDLFRNK